MTIIPGKRTSRSPAGRIILLAVFVALSSAIQAVENLIVPISLPFRPGIANIVTILVIAMFGLPEALLVAAARSVLAALISGKLLGIPFLLSLSGGLVSALVMGLLFRRTDGLGIVGVSILGSFAHNVAQLLVVYFLLMHNSAILILLPVLWLAALATGTGVGYAAVALLNTTPVKNYLSDEGAGGDIQDIKQE